MQHRHERGCLIGHQRKYVGQDLRIVETVQRHEGQCPDFGVIVLQQRKEIRFGAVSIFEKLRKLAHWDEFLRGDLPVFAKSINELVRP